MLPSIHRYIGALQGVEGDATPENGGELLDVAETVLANGGFVSSEIETVVRRSQLGDYPSAPLWRVIPFGLLFFSDLDRLESQSEKACRLSHGAPSDIAAAIAMALSIARLLRMEEIVPLQFVRDVAWYVKKIDRDAYTRILGLNYSLRGDLPFLCSNFTKPLEIFRAALFLFLSCQACDMETAAEQHGLKESPALPLAYTLMGSFGRLCRVEKPSLRVLVVAETFHKFADGAKVEAPEAP